MDDPKVVFWAIVALALAGLVAGLAAAFLPSRPRTTGSTVDFTRKPLG